MTDYIVRGEYRRHGAELVAVANAHLRNLRHRRVFTLPAHMRQSAMLEFDIRAERLTLFGFEFTVIARPCTINGKVPMEGMIIAADDWQLHVIPSTDLQGHYPLKIIGDAEAFERDMMVKKLRAS